MRPLADDGPKAERAAAIVRALAHPLRLRLVAALCQAEEGVAGLAERLSVSPTQVTRLLQPLLGLRLVTAREGGHGLRYRIAEPALHGLVACMEDCSD